jgi:hypothetical protein
MTGFLFVPVHSPSGDMVREKNLRARIFQQMAKFGFGNSGIGGEIALFGPFMH